MGLIPPADWIEPASCLRADAVTSSRTRSRLDFPEPLGPITTLRSPGDQSTDFSERNPSTRKFKIFMSIVLDLAAPMVTCLLVCTPRNLQCLTLDVVV